MDAFTDSVKKRLLLLLVLQVLSSLSISVNYKRNVNNIVAKTKIPLTPLYIECFLNDIVRLSAPVINKDDQYYISRPNGDETRIELNTNNELNSIKTLNFPAIAISVLFVNNSKAIVNQKSSYAVFPADEYDEKLKYLDPNEFMVGPLLEDFGNWVFSTYTKDLDGEWIELFQVITMAITAITVMEPTHPKLNIGDTFNLSFAYPLLNIESCEIIAPRTTFDRFYNRRMTDFNKCAFTIPNITKEDVGIWQITAVSRIIYTGMVTLELNEINSTTAAPVQTKKRKKYKKFL